MLWRFGIFEYFCSGVGENRLPMHREKCVAHAILLREIW